MKRFMDKLSNKQFPWGAIVSGATSLYNILSNDSQRGKNVESSKELMDYQTKKSQEQQAWLFQNQYPMQVQAMKAAGLNPALSSSQLGAVSANQPSSTLNQQAPQLNPLDVSRSISELALLNANRENIETDTEKKKADIIKTNAETDLLDADLVTYFDRLSASLNEQYERTHNFAANTEVQRRQLNVLDEQVNQLKAAQSQLIASAVESLANAKLTDKQVSTWDNEVRARIQQALSTAGYMSAQAKETLSLLMYKQFNYASLTQLQDSQSSLLGTNNDMQKFILQQDKKYNNANQILGMVKTATSSVADLAKAFKPF